MTLRRSQKQRGFNLIEAAIVLGIIGLVVAGIWLAAAAINEKREVNNVKEFIAYAQNLAIRYSQGYEMDSGTSISLKKLMPADEDLPGGFRRYFYTPTFSNLASENRKVVAVTFYNKILQYNGYNLNGSFDVNLYFVQDGTPQSSAWTYVPRPGVCAAILSGWLALAETKHIAVIYSVLLSPTVSWDSTSGATPPSVAICNTATYLYLNVVF